MTHILIYVAGSGLWPVLFGAVAGRPTRRYWMESRSLSNRDVLVTNGLTLCQDKRSGACPLGSDTCSIH